MSARALRNFLSGFALFAVLFAPGNLVGCGPVAAPDVPASGDVSPRVVVLSPGLAATIREIGRGDRIVGRHRFDLGDTSVPAVGDNLAIETELLLSLRPTVVVIEGGASAPPPGLTDTCDRLGAELVRVPVLSLGDLVASVEVIDRLTSAVGDDIPSDAAVRLIERYERAFAPDEAITALGRTLVIAASAPIGVTGPGSFHHDLFVSIGGDPVPHIGGAWLNLSAEDAAALRPDTVVLLTASASRVDPSARLPALASLLPEVFASGRVITIAADDVLLPGPGLIGISEQVKAAAASLDLAPQHLGAGGDRDG